MTVALDDPMTASDSWLHDSMIKPPGRWSRGWSKIVGWLTSTTMGALAALPPSGTGSPITTFSGRVRPTICGSAGDACGPASQLAPPRKASHLARDIQPNDPDTPAGLIVVDVDPRAGGHDELAHLLNRHGPLPATWTTETGSGGWHLWFSAGNLTAIRIQLARGIDLKTHNKGYLVAPPSVHPNGTRYRWLTHRTPRRPKHRYGCSRPYRHHAHGMARRDYRCE